jgi:organic radical activating enzyme
MSKLKISELFYSIQGEGRYMGVPSVFLRTFGCNFRCDGFGMPRGEKSVERFDIAFAHRDTAYKDYKDLPLVSTGCDSYASWDPAFKNLSPVLTADAIVDRIIELLPYKEWRQEHLVITGGEPLLGWQDRYPDLLENNKMKGLKDLTFETNGTQMLSDNFHKYLFTEWTFYSRKYDQLTFSVSPKLSVSGEKWSDAIRPDVVKEYEEIGFTYLKFVVASEDDVAEAEQAVSEYRAAGFDGLVYLMPVGGIENVYQLNNRRVADMALARGWRYSDRLQVPLYKNEWGT